MSLYHLNYFNLPSVARYFAIHNGVIYTAAYSTLILFLSQNAQAVQSALVLYQDRFKSIFLLY